MEVHVVVICGGVLGRLARWYGLTWNHAALRYARDPSTGSRQVPSTGSPRLRTKGPRPEQARQVPPAGGVRVIDSEACGVRELSWEKFVACAEEYKLFQVKGGLPDVTKREIVAYARGNVGKPYNYGWLLKIAWELSRAGS